MEDTKEHIVQPVSGDNMPSTPARWRTVVQWFVMRDLKRTNAKLPAYQMLGEMGMEVFTPMVWKIVELTNTLQYRFLRDGKRTPMTVRETEMERFKKAVEATVNHYYYTPKEVVPDMIGKRVRIVGGPLDGYEGNLQKMQGSRSKRLFVELPDLLTVAVEVQPEFIQIIK